MRVGFPITYFCGWMGGANLASLFTNSAYFASKHCFNDVSCFLLYEIDLNNMTIPDIGYIKASISQIQVGGVLGEFLKQSKYDDIYLYSDINLICDSLNLEIIGPSGSDLGPNFKIPWIGYISDFQHRHYPSFFNQKEILSREINFMGLIKNSEMTFVNSSTVVNDIHKFYAKNEINSIIRQFPPMMPFIINDISGDQLKDELNIANNYFIVCCQQWKHKRHDLIINAFSNFLKETENNFALYITGEEDDYRHPELKTQIRSLIASSGLMDSVKYLGLINREKQLALIDGSCALIQASVIEGGPGASGVMEAAALDNLIIASKIEANLEMYYGRHIYFPTDDQKSLTAAMIQASMLNSRHRKPIGKEEVEAVNLSAGIRLIRTIKSIA